MLLVSEHTMPALAPQVGEASFVHDESREDSSQALSAAAQPLDLLPPPALPPLLIPVSASPACLARLVPQARLGDSGCTLDSSVPQ